jgi:hypothetical protein
MSISAASLSKIDALRDIVCSVIVLCFGEIDGFVARLVLLLCAVFRIWLLYQNIALSKSISLQFGMTRGKASFLHPCKRL